MPDTTLAIIKDSASKKPRRAELSDEHWALIQLLLLPARTGQGRPRHDDREVIDRITMDTAFRCTLV